MASEKRPVEGFAIVITSVGGEHDGEEIGRFRTRLAADPDGTNEGNGGLEDATWDVAPVIAGLVTLSHALAEIYGMSTETRMEQQDDGD